MTATILVLIALMWVPVAFLLYGYGDIKPTGIAAGVVGLFTVVGATLQATVFEDSWTAGLLYAHGIFYMVLAYCFLTESDPRSAGNVSLTTAIISTIYAIVWLVGGPEVDGEVLVGQSWYLFIMAAIYAILTYEVFLNTHGKLSGKILGASLLIGVVISLWVPAFWLMVAGDLPF